MKNIGIVKYLNTLPLIHGLQKNQVRHNFKLVQDIPSKLADDLRDSFLDLALIPVIEYARSHEPYAIVREICIGSNGPVASVCLFFNKDLKDIRKVALDTSSRTSAALTKIILTEKFNLEPEFIPMPPCTDSMLKNADAALLIGDLALEYGTVNTNYFDLAEEWTEWTGLPFVFAVWTGLKEAWQIEQFDPLYESKKVGIASIEEISDAYAANHPQSKDFYKSYLTENIQYDLDGDKIESMKAFFELAFYHGLIENIPDIVFFGEHEEPGENPVQKFFPGK